MPDGIDADFSELRELAEDLTAAGTRIRPFARAAIQHTTFAIKKAWAANAAVSDPDGFVKWYPQSITYSTEEKASEIRAEIGPDLGRHGGSAGFLEEGTVLRPPQHAGRDALEANEQDFFQGLEIAAADALGDDAAPMVFRDGEA